MDDLLVILLKLSNDKHLDQILEIVKHTKDKITHRIKDIRHRHENCESVIGIEKVSEIEWVVPSASQARKFCMYHATVNRNVTFAVSVFICEEYRGKTTVVTDSTFLVN